uniref:FAM21/CAPZIP domain-containing protein n=1 Tax=Globisporangium ultimum (strain ATCC 200006 / CBS 805.95 / DAOM BR144) TaxID=431595 RepID=K3WFI5_GLOUD
MADMSTSLVVAAPYDAMANGADGSGYGDGSGVIPPPPVAPPPADSKPPAASSDAKTLADLAKEVSNWTLHSDRELHGFLKQYSSELFARTKHLEDTVRDIAMDADSASVRLMNTFNQFLMLSNSQFIENRVYDEEQEEFMGVENSVANPSASTGKTEEGGDANGTEAATAKTEAANTAKSAESVVTKYRTALEMGLEAMKLFAMLDDDDDTSDTSSQFDTVLDIYNERPLPFIIGTREFLEDETLGLGAAPDSDDSDSSSDESDSDYGSSYSSSDESVSSASTAPRKKRASRTAAAGAGAGHASSDEEDSDDSSLAPRRRSNSQESDTSGLFGRPPVSEPSPAARRPSLPPVPRQQSASGSRRKPAFASDADESESDDSDWSSDSDSDDDAQAKRKQKAKPAAAAVSIPQAPVPELPPRAQQPASAKKNQFFDSSDDDDSDGGLFGAPPKSKPTNAFFPAEEETKQSAPTSLFAEQSSNDLFGTAPTPAATPAIKRQPSRRTDSFDSSSDDDDDEGNALFGSSEPKGKAPPQQPQGFRLPAFGSKPQEQQSATPAASAEAKRVYFSDDSDAESTVSGLFGRTSSRKAPAGAAPILPPQQRPRLDLSDDSSDDDNNGGLFGAAPKKTAPPPVSAQAKPIVPPTAAAVVPPRRPMYSDDSSDDDDDDGGLFGAKPAPKAEAKPTPQPAQLTPASNSVPVQRAPKSSLFDEEDSDESDADGLFGARKPTNAAPPLRTPATLPTTVPARTAPVLTRTRFRWRVVWCAKNWSECTFGGAPNTSCCCSTTAIEAITGAQ